MSSDDAAIYLVEIHGRTCASLAILMSATSSALIAQSDRRKINLMPLLALQRACIYHFALHHGLEPEHMDAAIHDVRLFAAETAVQPVVKLLA